MLIGIAGKLFTRYISISLFKIIITLKEFFNSKIIKCVKKGKPHVFTKNSSITEHQQERLQQTQFFIFILLKDKLFRIRSSGKEHGTVTWAMNVMQTSNAKKGPHKAMNAYSEYCDKELDAQIAAITMDYLNMKNFEGKPQRNYTFHFRSLFEASSNYEVALSLHCIFF